VFTDFEALKKTFTAEVAEERRGKTEELSIATLRAKS